MDISKLSNDGLMFVYFSNKKQLDMLYKQQKEIEGEVSNRIEDMRIKARKGEFVVLDE
ncbi:MAG: hypothetical protein AB7G87_10725 [Clostridia bacterium]